MPFSTPQETQATKLIDLDPTLLHRTLGEKREHATEISDTKVREEVT